MASQKCWKFKILNDDELKQSDTMWTFWIGVISFSHKFLQMSVKEKVKDLILDVSFISWGSQYNFESTISPKVFIYDLVVI